MEFNFWLLWIEIISWKRRKSMGHTNQWLFHRDISVTPCFLIIIIHFTCQTLYNHLSERFGDYVQELSFKVDFSTFSMEYRLSVWSKEFDCWKTIQWSTNQEQQNRICKWYSERRIETIITSSHSVEDVLFSCWLLLLFFLFLFLPTFVLSTLTFEP